MCSNPLGQWPLPRRDILQPRCACVWLPTAGHWVLHTPLPPSIVFLRFKFVNKAVKLVSDSAVDQITCTKSKVPAVVDAAEIDTASDLDLDHAPDSGSKPRCEVWRLERAPKLLHQYALCCSCRRRREDPAVHVHQPHGAQLCEAHTDAIIWVWFTA